MNDDDKNVVESILVDELGSVFNLVAPTISHLENTIRSHFRNNLAPITVQYNDMVQRIRQPIASSTKEITEQYTNLQTRLDEGIANHLVDLVDNIPTSITEYFGLSAPTKTVEPSVPFIDDSFLEGYTISYKGKPLSEWKNTYEYAGLVQFAKKTVTLKDCWYIIYDTPAGYTAYQYCPLPVPPPEPQPEPQPKPEPTPKAEEKGKVESCLKICGLEDLISAIKECCKRDEKDITKEDKKKWKLYKNERGVCYLIEEDSKPNSLDDILLWEGFPGPEMVGVVVRECCQKVLQCPEPKPTTDVLINVVRDCVGITAVTYTSVAQWAVDVVTWVENELAKPLGFFAGSIFRTFIAPWTNFIKTVGVVLGNVADRYIGFAGCNDPRFPPVVIQRLLLAWIKSITGLQLDLWEQTLIQQQNALCPYLLPTPNEAVVSFLANRIDSNTLRCWITAAGFRWEEYTKVIEANATRLSNNEIVAATRRGLIPQNEYLDRLRDNGVLDIRVANELWSLSEQLPGVSDLIRMMVRDADDQSIVNRFRLDDQFSDKFGGRLRKWAEQQGVPEEFMKYVWRSHWDIPSPTQLYEMFRRYRHLPDGHPLKTTVDDVKTALVQNDVLPFWVDRLLGIAFNPLTRTDAKRAYKLGVINRKQLKDSYIEGGYNDENAETLTEFTVRDVRRSWVSEFISKAYLTGGVDETTLRNELANLGASVEDIEWTISRLKLTLNVNRRNKCIASVKYRYMVGEFDYNTLVGKLIDEGVSNDQAIELAKMYECERSSKGKQVPARTLCGWFMNGVIDSIELYRRLINLRYTPQDAEKLVADCTFKLQTRLTREEQKRLRQIQSEYEKNQKKLEAEARKREQQVARIEAAREKSKNIRNRREDKLLDAARKLVDNTGISLGEALREVRYWLRDSYGNSTLTKDQIVFALVDIASLKGLKTLEEYRKAYFEWRNNPISSETTYPE